jgi:iron complex outermembrane recepter protein
MRNWWHVLTSTTLARWSTLVAFFVLGGIAQAQPAAQDNDSTKAAGLEEIVVTAERRSERLEDVPMAITALSSEDLIKAGVVNIMDLGQVVPGLLMSANGINVQPAIRGVTSNGGGVGDNPAVAVYLDGIYEPNQLTLRFDLPDVEQVEVLKGPQGTLWGQDATGGAILVTTKSPSFTPTGNFSVSYGNFDDVQLRGFATGPITDSVAASFSVAYQHREGFRQEVLTGQRDISLDSQVYRAKVLFQLSDSSKITLTASYADRKDGDAMAGDALNNNSVAYSFLPDAPKVTNPITQYGTNSDAYIENKIAGFSAKGEFGTAAGTLTVSSSFQSSTTSYVFDLDGTPVYYFDSAIRDWNTQDFQNQFDFNSRKFGRFSFLLGGMYLYERDNVTGDQVLFYVPALPPAPQVVALDLQSAARYEKEIAAAYAELHVDITDKLVLTAGGRFTSETDSLFNNSNPAASNVLVGSPWNDPNWTKTTPRATARYAISPDSNIYATYSQGFKGGIINWNAPTQPPANPETATSYEVGYKGQPLPDLSVNLDGFYYTYKDLQLLAYVNVGPGLAPVAETKNAAAARGYGSELTTRWAVTHDFTLSANLAYLVANFTSAPNMQGFMSTGVGNVAITQDLTGKPMLRSPRFSGNVSANYEIETSIGRFGAFASVFDTSSYYLEPTISILQSGYATVDGQVSYEPAGLRGLKLVLWGKNLNNRAYLNSVVISSFSDWVQYANPRTFGVRAEYSF